MYGFLCQLYRFQVVHQISNVSASPSTSQAKRPCEVYVVGDVEEAIMDQLPVIEGGTPVTIHKLKASPAVTVQHSLFLR